ncbi:2Fe-2S iron-sulfur cluster-binding protein [Pelagibacterium lacus]|uniref:Ferredoxin n=1 Tax=Pelagibacterium lacus TaxID=2282655 RepID=A0A369W873_9HYPH|nr:2Fe-2S iron-sulfur cluster-binding protein [Pelagibacterium lacus]RDE10237.1 ferredoxin [Pelagibacterium lacus]
MRIFVTDQNGIEHELEALEGWRVMEVIRDWGLNIKAECGGSCACATCHIFVDPEWQERLNPPTDEEEDMLDSVPDYEANSRLSCQILMREDLDGLRVRLADSARQDEAA